MDNKEESTAAPAPAASDEKINSAKKLTAIIYALYASSFFIGITGIIAIAINYIKQDDVAGTFLESHFRWQMRTFLFGLLWAVVGSVLLIVFVGYFVLLADVVWIAYRVIKGALYLNDNKSMYVITLKTAKA